MRPPELQRDPAVTQMLRQAMDLDRLRRVLRMAGADEVVGDAAQALQEAAADALARRLRRPGLLPRLPEPGADANTVEEARAATKKAYLDLAVHMADAQVPTEAVRQALALHLVALAQHAVRFARSEGRALDHHCIAVAAGRCAEASATPAVVAGV